MSTFTPGPRIYNLFPRLVGSMDRWPHHLPRIREMGFDWVYVNPFHYPGFSGSLYAVKDYYGYHPVFVNANLPEDGEAQLVAFLEAAHALGLKVMMDLVINHTAFDSVLATEHPEWFKQKEDGSLLRPGAWDGETWVEWGDLVTIDNDGPHAGAIGDYWLAMMKHYLDLGIDGFRCDAAYHVPDTMWRRLIPGVRSFAPDTGFFAETLGCRPWELIMVADCGFDYVFNSVRWWDFQAPWFPEAQARVVGAAPSIAFAESHDTQRLAEELNGHPGAIMQRYLFSALFSSGVLTTLGFEFGFRDKLDVVNTYPEHWGEEPLNLIEFIKQANALKASERVFNVDAPLFEVNTHNPKVKAFLKGTPDARQHALLVVNLDLEEPQEVHLPRVADTLGARSVRDVSLVSGWERLHEEDLHATIAPAGLQVLLSSNEPPEAETVLP